MCCLFFTVTSLYEEYMKLETIHEVLHEMPTMKNKNMAARSEKCYLRVYKTFSRDFLRADLPSGVQPKFKGRKKPHSMIFLGVKDCDGFDGIR